MPGDVPRLARPVQKYNTTSLPLTKANDRAGMPIAQHLIHEPASSTKVNERLSASDTVACISERSVISPRSVTRNGTLHRPTNSENSLMHPGGIGAIYASFKRKGDLGVSTTVKVVPGRLLRGVIECNIRIVVSEVPFQYLLAGRSDTRKPSKSKIGFLVCVILE